MNTAFSADRSKVSALPQQRRALRRVVLNKGVYQKPVLAPLPVFCPRTAGTTFAESNSHPATLWKRARETADIIGASKYKKSLRRRCKCGEQLAHTSY